MAKDNREDLTSELTVTIDADVDEAVTGLKRLQREIRKTTQEVRELESACEDVEKAVNIRDVFIEIDGEAIGKAIKPDIAVNKDV